MSTPVRRGSRDGAVVRALALTKSVARVRFRLGVICGLSLLLVLAFLQGFFSVIFGFPPS